jgi:hypothetical protein
MLPIHQYGGCWGAFVGFGLLCGGWDGRGLENGMVEGCEEGRVHE